MWSNLSKWLLFVAGLRGISVIIGIFNPKKFKTTVIDKRPELVSDLFGRLFAAWTTISCALCVICANNINNKPVYGATLFSFIVALTFFVSERFIFKTVSSKGFMSPCIIASVSTIWMITQWKYYVGNQ
mmetsp:Transcript_20335/g.36511  ORF Transcript_20335/g.36511 Transcript_20335/m.36511 type:complete len:129 (-) Transcript_20335:367-753(-)